MGSSKSLLKVVLFSLSIISWSVDGLSSETTLVTSRVATGLDRIVDAVSPPGDAERLFVVEQRTGRIKILNLADNSINSQPFLDIDGLSTGSEQGLLGLAFDPNYANNGHFYVNLTDTGGRTHIRRYTVSENSEVADAASARTILTFSQPAANHNGGWIDFGPSDGFLYIGTGDGGNANDSGAGHTSITGNSQDTTNNLLGKLLRIDVHADEFPGDDERNYAIPASNPFVGQTGDNEIWAYGLRNPWRNSFDRQTGDLYIADVGQNVLEEINVQPAGSTGGINYGWRLREGTISTPSGGVGGAKPAGAIDPIYEYGHGAGPSEGFSVTGGYVYRGPIEELQGHYFFADYVSNRVWSLRFDGSDPTTHDGSNFTDFIDWTPLIRTDFGSVNRVSSFAEDGVGNLYIIRLFGDIFRIDSLEFTPDPGDVDQDGDVDQADFRQLARNFGVAAGALWIDGDLNGDGRVGISDLVILQNRFGSVGNPAIVPEPSTLSLLWTCGFFVAAGFVLRRRSQRAHVTGV